MSEPKEARRSFAGLDRDADLFRLSLDELVALETRQPTRVKRMRQGLPYGLWSCLGGREILFNRLYVPIWQRRPGLATERADPNEWIEWTEQRYLFDDTDSPWSPYCGKEIHRATRLRVDRVLSDFLSGEVIGEKFWQYSTGKYKGVYRDGSVIAGKQFARFSLTSRNAR
jgi:hypothetical protein